ncbi:MAG: hypothetical protein Q7S96_02985 [bacterium]|nr:hypothetical protein [bacterium]
MRFGPINRFVLFGGGTRLAAFAQHAIARGYGVIVCSAPRLLTAVLDGTTVTVEQHLRDMGIPFHSITDLRAFPLETLVDERTIGISFGAPWIFRNEHLVLFAGRLLNAHGTCLPENRGAATFSWQVMRDDRRGAFLFHEVDAGVDSGPIIAMESYMFPETCRTPAEYRAYHVAHEPDFFARFLDRLRVDDDFPHISQDEARATYFPRLATAEHGFVDWRWSGEEIAQFIAAFDDPYSGAMTFLRGARVTLHGATTHDRDGAFHPFMSGLIIRVHDDGIAIAAHDRTLVVRAVRPIVGEKPPVMRPGVRCATPQSVLDAARAFEAVYDAHGLRTDASRISSVAPSVWQPASSPSTSAP